MCVDSVTRVCLKVGFWRSIYSMSAKKIVVSLIVLATTMLSVSVGAYSPAQAQTQKSIRFGTQTGAFIDNVNALLVKNFNTLHPDVTVNVEPIPGAQLETTLAAE